MGSINKVGREGACLSWTVTVLFKGVVAVFRSPSAAGVGEVMFELAELCGVGVLVCPWGLTRHVVWACKVSCVEL